MSNLTWICFLGCSNKTSHSESLKKAIKYLSGDNMGD